ncbi:MAG: AI-2E family transporter [Bacteroidetes bacterium]|nr:AI-2E family transporter [Bacteroidota bacterium]
MIKKLQAGVPFYLKISVILLGLVAFFYVVFIAQNIILPLVFAVLVSILLNPLVNFLTNRKVNRILAIIISIILALLVMAGIIIFIISQFDMFGEAMPTIKQKATSVFQQITAWGARTFNLSYEKMNSYITKETKEGISHSNAVIGSTVTTISRVLIMLVLIPVYIFLLLVYKPLILKFISKLFPVELHVTVLEVLAQSKLLIQQYLIGILLELAMVSTLTAIGLFCIGIQSPILFGVITGLLNMIPYVGVLIANAAAVLIALVTKSPSAALLVLGLYILVQFIDNNFIVPKVIGSKVQINALATIITVLVGGELCGIAGMFLAIPVTAVFKVICDKVPPLEPLGYLLGDEMPSAKKKIFNIRLPLKTEDKRKNK